MDELKGKKAEKIFMKSFANKLLPGRENVYEIIKTNVKEIGIKAKSDGVLYINDVMIIIEKESSVSGGQRNLLKWYLAIKNKLIPLKDKEDNINELNLL